MTVGRLDLVASAPHARTVPAPPAADASGGRTSLPRLVRRSAPPLHLGGTYGDGGWRRRRPLVRPLLTLGYLLVAVWVAGAALDAIGMPLDGAQVGRIAAAGLVVVGAGVGLVAGRLALRGSAALARLVAAKDPAARTPARARPEIALLAGMLAAWVAAAGLATLVRDGLDAASPGARLAAAADAVRIAGATARLPAPRGFPAADADDTAAGDAADADPAFSPALLSSPAGRAVLALRLATTGRLSGNVARTRAPAASVPPPWRTALETLAMGRIGTPAEVYDHVFIPSVRAVRDAYNRYVEAQLRFVDALKAVPQEADAAWGRVMAALPGHDPDALGRLDPAQVAAALAGAGLDLPAGWQPGDRGAFIAMAGAVLQTQAADAYGAAVRRILGTEVPPGLAWDDFAALPAVQASWARMLGGTADTPLQPRMGPERFRLLVYAPRLRATTAPAAAVLDGAVPLVPGAGRPALAWAAVPSLVFLALTPLLALHLVLLLLDLSALATATRWHRAALVIGISACLVIGWLGTPPPVGALAGAYSAAEDAVALRAGPLWLAGRFAARTAPFLARVGTSAALREATWPGAVLRRAGIAPVVPASAAVTGLPAIDAWLPRRMPAPR